MLLDKSKVANNILLRSNRRQMVEYNTRNIFIPPIEKNNLFDRDKIKGNIGNAKNNDNKKPIPLNNKLIDVLADVKKKYREDKNDILGKVIRDITKIDTNKYREVIEKNSIIKKTSDNTVFPFLYDHNKCSMIKQNQNTFIKRNNNSNHEKLNKIRMNDTDIINRRKLNIDRSKVRRYDSNNICFSHKQ